MSDQQKGISILEILVSLLLSSIIASASLHTLKSTMLFQRAQKIKYSKDFSEQILETILDNAKHSGEKFDFIASTIIADNKLVFRNFLPDYILYESENKFCKLSLNLGKPRKSPSKIKDWLELNRTGTSEKLISLSLARLKDSKCNEEPSYFKNKEDILDSEFPNVAWNLGTTRKLKSILIPIENHFDIYIDRTGSLKHRDIVSGRSATLLQPEVPAKLSITPSEPKLKEVDAYILLNSLLLGEESE